MSLPFRGSTFLCAALLLSASASAQAQPSNGHQRQAAASPPSDAERAKAHARSLGLDALDAMKRRAYAEALDFFTRAEAFYHAPTLVLGIARAHAKLGELVEAQRAYDRLLGEKLPDDAPEAFQKAVEEGREERTRLLPRVPHLELALDGPPQTELRLNGVRLSSTTPQGGYLTNPGTYSLTARAAGFKEARADFELREGETKKVELHLKPKGDLFDPLPGPRQGEAQRTWGWLTVGVAGASLLAGAVTGGLAVDRHKRLDSACPGGHCDASRTDLHGVHDDYLLFGNLATGLLVFGGASLATGALLLFTAPTDGNTTASACALGAPAGLALGICGKL